MKGICLLALLSFTINCFSQDRTMFDKIIITYNRGGDTFGAPGISSVGEIFELMPGNKTSYKFTYYKKTQDSISPDTKRYLKDTLNMPLKKGSISKSKIEALFAALSTTRDNFTPEFIRPFLKTPSDAQILADTNYADKGYKFEDEDKEDLKAEFLRIKKFDKLDSFINLNRPDTAISKVTVDAWDVLIISFIKNSDTTVFKEDFLELLGQPVLKLRTNKQFIMKQFVNLETNALLAEILPISSIAKKRVGINSLTDDYIKWYIDKVL